MHPTFDFGIGSAAVGQSARQGSQVAFADINAATTRRVARLSSDLDEKPRLIDAPIKAVDRHGPL